jgi:hypothetical protein
MIPIKALMVACIVLMLLQSVCALLQACRDGADARGDPIA